MRILGLRWGRNAVVRWVWVIICFTSLTAIAFAGASKAAASAWNWVMTCQGGGRLEASSVCHQALVPDRGDTLVVEEALLAHHLIAPGKSGTQALPDSLLTPPSPKQASPNPRLARLMLPSGLLGGAVRAPGMVLPQEVMTQQVAGTTLRVSLSSDGVQGDGGCFSPLISPDGGWVVFEAAARNLVPQVFPQTPAILLRNLLSGVTSLESLSWSGAPADAGCFWPFVTGNARFIGFLSTAKNLVEGYNGAPGPAPGIRVYPQQVYVRDRLQGKTAIASLNDIDEPGNNTSWDVSISDDGTLVAYSSVADNLVPADTNGAKDVFVRDMARERTYLLSVAPNGHEANASSYAPVISANGQCVAFVSSASNLVPGDTNRQADVFVRELKGAGTVRVSVTSSGAQANGWSDFPSISADGRYVAFLSTAPNLVSNDANGPFWDVFVHDCATGQTELVSVMSAEYLPGFAKEPRISADGRYVAFLWVSSAEGEASNVELFVRDRQAGETKKVELVREGAMPDTALSLPSLSAHGRYVAFESSVSNLVVGDTNNASDVFVHEQPGPTPVARQIMLTSLGSLPVVTSISPNEGKSGEIVVCTISGQHLNQRCAVTLRAPWRPWVAGRVLGASSDGTSLKVEMLLLAEGDEDKKWDLYVVNPDGGKGVLPQAFTIRSALPRVRVSISAPARVRWGSMVSAYVTAYNPHTEASPPTMVEIRVQEGRILGVKYNDQTVAEGGDGEPLSDGWLMIPSIPALGRVSLKVEIEANPRPPGTGSVHTQAAPVLVVVGGAFICSEAGRFAVKLLTNAAKYYGYKMVPDLASEYLPPEEAEVVNIGVWKKAYRDWYREPWEQPGKWAVNTAISMLFSYIGNAWRAQGEAYLDKMWQLPEGSPERDALRELGKLCYSHANKLDDLARYYRWTWSGVYSLTMKWFSPDPAYANEEAKLSSDCWDEARQKAWLVNSVDPNYKVGPGAQGEAAWVSAIPQLMQYYVHFENKAEATAEAENIVITDQLSPNLDWGTLEFAGASHPQVLQHEFNQATGTITWRLTGINLPPNKTPPEGEGWVAFYIKPKPGLPHGTEIKNTASIVFDYNPPLATNTTVVHIDRQPPASRVLTPERVMGQTSMVSWTGDDRDESGVMFYDVYVSEDSGPYRCWMKMTDRTSALFEGQPGHSYAFYSIATDLAGNVEQPPEQPDAVLGLDLDQGWLVSFDFNRDGCFDELDIGEFVKGWQRANAVVPAEVDSRFDLAPCRGELPNIEAQPDGKIDRRDAELVFSAWLKLRKAAGWPAAVPLSPAQ